MIYSYITITKLNKNAFYDKSFCENGFLEPFYKIPHLCPRNGNVEQFQSTFTNVYSNIVFFTKSKYKILQSKMNLAIIKKFFLNKQKSTVLSYSTKPR